MWSIIEYLKRPELVVSVQEWFGIEYEDSTQTKSTKENSEKIYDHGKSLNQYSNYPEHKKQRRKQNNESECATNTKQTENNQDDEHIRCQITNKFWYYLFVIGTELGDEIFYATMIPFWFWNIDGAVGRRVVFIWSIVMYVGQVLKDIIRWPRPGPPVQRLQSKWSIEYGMPSTHAMVCYNYISSF